MVKIFLSTVLLMAVSFNSHAKTLWSDYSLSYLNGSDYEVGDNKKQVWTIEYVSGTSWGDHFMFFDRLESDDGSFETYGEFSPRIRVSDASFGFFENIYLAPSVEMGPSNNYLWGIGTDVKVPHFTFMKLSFYIRDNGNGDNSFQTTLSWGVPLGPFYYDGFIDWATGADNVDVGGGIFVDNETQMNFTSQLKYDLGPHLNLKTKLFVGIEYVFWNNKFGIKDTPEFKTNERNANLLVKYHF